MSVTRLVLTIVVIFVLASVFGTLIHAILLHDDYAGLPQVFLPAREVKLQLIFFANLAFSIGSVWMYAHGVEDKPWFGQGVRFGVAVWLVLAVPSFLIAYATQPIPEALLWKQLGFEFINKIVLGVITAALVRKT